MLALFRLVSGIEPWMIVSRLGVRDGGSATFVFAMPGIALFAGCPAATFPIVVVVREVAPIGVTPIGGTCGWRVEVLHLDGQGLQLLERVVGAHTLEGQP
jgi:hypothetical protein